MQNIKRRTFWLLAIVGLLFTITACSKSGGSEDEMKISFANNSYEYVVGETFTLNPSIQNGTAEDSELVWSVFDESVVKLVNGEFVALKEGKTIIKVASSTKSNVSALVSIKVVEKKYFPVVSFNEIKGTMQVDEQQVILPTVEGYDFNAVVTYRSLDSNVASVSEQGTVVAFNTGATVIVVRIEEVGNASNYEEYPFLIQVVEPEYAIDYVLNGGKNHLENLDYYTKRQCPVVLKEPTRDGYKFLGWYDLEGNQVTEISKYEEADVTLEAKWEIVEYSANFTLVDFVIENVSTDGDEILLCEDKYDTPTKWWSFIGINKTEKENLFEIMATGYQWDGIADSYDYYIAIHGDYRFESDEKYDTYYRLISLLMDNANAVGKYVYIDMSTSTNMSAAIYEEMDTYTINEYVNPFVTPVRVGHDFLGWYSVDENGVESSEPVTSIERRTTGNKTFIANWTPSKYVVKYNLNGGEGVAKDYYTFVYSDAKGDDYVLQTPTRKGYTFDGWYKETDFSGEKVTEIAKGTLGDQEFYAKWNLDTYTITYNTNGGLALGTNPTEYTTETPTFELFDCEKMYYNFVGWEDQEGNVYTDIKQGSAGHLTLTAKYTPCEYDIVYNLNGGEGEESGKYTYSESEAYVLQVPTREGYEFKGWCVNADLSDTPVTEIAALDNGAKEYYAKWEIIEYTITYNLDGGSIAKVYANRDEVVNELLDDYNSYSGKSHTTSSIFALGSWKEISTASLFLYKNIDKWGWLVDYIATVAGDANKEAYKNFRTYSDQVSLNAHNSNYIYSIAYEFRAFIGGAQYTSNKYYYTADYAEESIANGFWDFIPEESYTIETESFNVAPAIKTAYNFDGWYDSENNKVESIEKGTTGNIELTAKWQLSTYTISYDLQGGSFNEYPVEYATKADMVADYIKDVNKVYGTSHTKAEETHKTVRNNAGKFWKDSEMWAKWKWMLEYFVVLSKKQFDSSGYKYYVSMYNNGDSCGSISGYVTQSFVMYLLGINASKWTSSYSSTYGGISSKWTTLDFTSESESAYQKYMIFAPRQYDVTSDDITLIEPTKDGLVFGGWYTAWDSENGVVSGSKVTQIESGSYGNKKYFAKWIADSIKIGDVCYESLEDAIANAQPGDVITLKAGTYDEAITINKAITIKGANAGIDPVTGTRLDETIFKNDIVIAANGIEIDGIKLTGNGRIKGNASGFDGLVIKNVSIADSTVNSGGSSSNGPLYFYTTGTSEFKNIVIENVKLTGGTSRPMIMYGSQINGLTIKNSSFVSVRSTYNDAIKIVKGGSYGIKGNVTIVGNHIENYQQYVLWFGDYAEGTYNIYNNNFVNCGITPANHGAAYFATYSGATTGKVEVDFSYNTVDNAYSLIRVSSTDAKTSSNHTIKCNYNKLLNCSATYYVNNADADISVDARYNYYDSTISDSKFLNAIYSDYYTSEEDVPTYPGE